MSSHASDRAGVIPLRPVPAAPRPAATGREAAAQPTREPLWRHVVGGVLRGERLAQERTLKEVAEAARISMPYLSEVERGRKEASSEVLAAAAHALGLSLTDVLTLVQSELARRARPARPSVSRRAPGPEPGQAGAAERGDGTAASASVQVLNKRQTRARAVPRPGDVRLAA